MPSIRRLAKKGKGGETSQHEEGQGVQNFVARILRDRWRPRQARMWAREQVADAPVHKDHQKR